MVDCSEAMEFVRQIVGSCALVMSWTYLIIGAEALLGLGNWEAAMSNATRSMQIDGEPNHGVLQENRLFTAIVLAAIIGAAGLITTALLAGLFLTRPNIRDPSGWYLMTPPLGQLSNGVPIPDSDSPLSHWQVEHAFGTAKECESFREDHQEKSRAALDAREASAKPGTNDLWKASLEQEIDVICISTRDPRLAKN
jgi:hypothetical protein